MLKISVKYLWIKHEPDCVDQLIKCKLISFYGLRAYTSGMHPFPPKWLITKERDNSCWTLQPNKGDRLKVEPKDISSEMNIQSLKHYRSFKTSSSCSSTPVVHLKGKVSGLLKVYKKARVPESHTYLYNIDKQVSN